MPRSTAPLAATLAADAATAAAVLFGVLCPGDELAVDALRRNRRGQRAARAAPIFSTPTSRASVRPARARAVLQAGFFPRPAAVHQLYRPAVVRRRRAAAARRCHAAHAAARRRIRPGAALHRDRPHRCHHVPKLLAQRGAGHCWIPTRTSTRRAGQCGVAPRHRGRGAATAACPAPGACGARTQPTGKVSIIIPTCAAHGYIENCIATLRARTAVPELRDRLHRQHPRQPDGMEDLAAAERRSHRRHSRAVQLVALQQPGGGGDRQRIPAVPQRRHRDHAGRLAGRAAGACAAAGSGHRRPAIAVSVRQGAARRHVPRRRHRPPCVPLLRRGRAGLFRPGADPAQRHRGDRRLHADAPRACSSNSAGSTRRIRSSTTTSTSACARTRPAS